MNRSRSLLLASAAVFAVAGAAFFLFPQALLRHLGIELGSPAAVGDVRAVYGGLEIAVAVVLARAAVEPATVRWGLGVAATLFAGLAAARAISIPIDGVPQSTGFVLLAAETVGALLAFYGYRSADRI